MDYRGFSYRIKYTYRFLDDNEQIIRQEDVSSVCFSRVFDYLKPVNEIYHANYILHCEKIFERGSGNFCSLSKDQIIKIMRYMRRTMNVDIKCKEDDTQFHFYINVIGKPVKHKFILTFCRVFYEYPYNEFAKEVFRVRQQGIVKNINYANKSFIELYHMINHVYSRFWGGGHSLFIYPSLILPSKQMKQAFEEGRSSVQSVYAGDRDLLNVIKQPRVSYDEFCENYWTEEGIKKRINKYSENFNIIKKLKKSKNEK